MAEWQENYQLYKRYVKNITLIYQKRKDIRSYIELMLSLVVIVIFSLFAIRPTLVTIAELNKEIADKQATVKKLDEKINNLQQAQKSANQNARSITFVDTAVPNSPLPVLYSRQIEGLAKQYSVELFNLSVSGVDLLKGVSQQKTTTPPATATDWTADSVSYMEYSFDVRGDYDNLKQFISEIERLRRPTLVESMTLRQNTDKDTNTNGITFSVIGKVPFLPDNE